MLDSLTSSYFRSQKIRIAIFESNIQNFQKAPLTSTQPVKIADTFMTTFAARDLVARSLCALWASDKGDSNLRICGFQPVGLDSKVGPILALNMYISRAKKQFGLWYPLTGRPEKNQEERERKKHTKANKKLVKVSHQLAPEHEPKHGGKLAEILTKTRTKKCYTFHTSTCTKTCTIYASSNSHQRGQKTQLKMSRKLAW
jgi:hypothetical protein